jgi:hypothetical protein
LKHGLIPVRWVITRVSSVRRDEIRNWAVETDQVKVHLVDHPRWGVDVVYMITLPQGISPLDSEHAPTSTLRQLTHDLVIRAESDPVADSDPFVDELDVAIRVVSTKDPPVVNHARLRYGQRDNFETGGVTYRNSCPLYPASL